MNQGSTLDIETYIHEVDEYICQLATDLGHPYEKQRVIIMWRAVMHTIRDRIPRFESADKMSPSPAILRGMYTLGWKYTERPVYDYDTIEEMVAQVEALQHSYGDAGFDWEKSTEEIISIILNSLEKYYPDNQIEHIKKHVPAHVEQLI